MEPHPAAHQPRKVRARHQWREIFRIRFGKRRLQQPRRQEQVQEHAAVRQSPDRPYRPPGRPRPGLLPQHQDPVDQRGEETGLALDGVQSRPMPLAMRLQLNPNLNWWLRTDAGTTACIAIGIGIFRAFAVADLARIGRRATRWREYLFLIAGVAAVCIYGAINDLITSRLSWEYFYYGKGLADALGPLTPPDWRKLAAAAVKVGVQATW